MGRKTVYLAGGCFWGTQKFFDQFDGVLSTEVGYANGPSEHPSYEEVCRSSGHAETVRVDYDPERVSLRQLLDWYFLTVDPTSYHRQGGDMGVQYRTGIYAVDGEDLPLIRARCAEEQEKYRAPLLVEVGMLESFWPAEEYHQKYLDKNPGGYCHIPRRLLCLETKKTKGTQTP